MPPPTTSRMVAKARAVARALTPGHRPSCFNCWVRCLGLGRVGLGVGRSRLSTSLPVYKYTHTHPHGRVVDHGRLQQRPLRQPPSAAATAAAVTP